MEEAKVAVDTSLFGYLKPVSLALDSSIGPDPSVPKSWARSD